MLWIYSSRQNRQNPLSSLWRQCSVCVKWGDKVWNVSAGDKHWGNSGAGKGERGAGVVVSWRFSFKESHQRAAPRRSRLRADRACRRGCNSCPVSEGTACSKAWRFLQLIRRIWKHLLSQFPIFFFFFFWWVEGRERKVGVVLVWPASNWVELVIFPGVVV